MYGKRLHVFQRALSRRQLLAGCSSGFGLVALSGIAHSTVADFPAPWQRHQAKAKNVILCYMSGGVSQIDSFAPKPKLKELHGQPMPVKVERTQFNRNGQVFASPFRFDRYGESGLEVSEIFPHVATCVDEMAVIRSMHAPPGRTF